MNIAQQAIEDFEETKDAGASVMSWFKRWNNKADESVEGWMCIAPNLIFSDGSAIAIEHLQLSALPTTVREVSLEEAYAPVDEDDIF